MIGVGAGLALVVLLVVQAATSSGVFGTATTTETITSTTTTAYSELSSSFANHLLNVESGNVSLMMTDYEQNATVMWEGKIVQDLGGSSYNETGAGNIASFYDEFFGPSGVTNVTITNVTITAVQMKGDGEASVNSTFNLAGPSDNFGYLSGTVSAQIEYAKGGGDMWLISSETWNFMSLVLQHGYEF